jgi:transketolase
MSTWRPCDQVESAVAWKYGVERQDGPTALILSRQNLAQQDRTDAQLANIARGGYVLKDCAGQPELIFIATGSEVELAVAAWDKLSAEGVKARVVSMPSTDAFDKQDAAYRESVLPKAVSARVAVEAGIADGKILETLSVDALVAGDAKSDYTRMLVNASQQYSREMARAVAVY